METNILGLPSLTGFTPLKAAQEGKVLKYDFRGLGPRVLDKSGNFNGGTLKPLWPVNSPRRSIPPRALTFDGEDDYVLVPDDRTLHMGRISLGVTFESLDEHDTVLGGVVSKREDKNNYFRLTLYHADTPNPSLLWEVVIGGTKYSTGVGVQHGQKYDVLATANGDELVLYLDGEEVDRVSGAFSPTAGPLRIGHGALQPRNLLGTVQRVEIWNEVKKP